MLDCLFIVSFVEAYISERIEWQGVIGVKFDTLFQVLFCLIVVLHYGIDASKGILSLAVIMIDCQTFFVPVNRFLSIAYLVIRASQTKKGILVGGINLGTLFEPLDGIVILFLTEMNKTHSIIRCIILRIDLDCFMVPFKWFIQLLFLLVYCS